MPSGMGRGEEREGSCSVLLFRIKKFEKKKSQHCLSFAPEIKDSLFHLLSLPPSLLLLFFFFSLFARVWVEGKEALYFVLCCVCVYDRHGATHTERERERGRETLSWEP